MMCRPSWAKVASACDLPWETGEDSVTLWPKSVRIRLQAPEGQSESATRIQLHGGGGEDKGWVKIPFYSGYNFLPELYHYNVIIFCKEILIS